MKKIFKRLLIFALILIGLFLIIPLFLDDSYSLNRTTVIDKDKETVKNFMADFSNFQQWSPWAEMDKNITVEITGEPGEVGSSYSWEGNEDVGKGIMEITKVTEDTVHVLLKFKEPFESESPTYYALKETDNGTEVTWYMEGEMSYPMNIMLLFMDMEKSIGKDFDKGLKNLKDVIASMQKPQPTADFSNIHETEIPDRKFVGVQENVTFSEIQPFYAENLPKIYGYVNENFTLSGAPTGLYFSWNEDKVTTTMAAAIPIAELNAEIDTTYSHWVLGGKVLKYEHYGSYDSINLAHERLDAYMLSNDMTKKAPVIEEYVTDPGQEPDTTKWQTNVYYLLK